MDKTPVVKGERRRKRIAALLIALAFLVLIGAFAVYHIKTGRAIERHLQGLRAAGEPVTLEEITREYKSLKAEENGAEAYSQAFSLMTNVALLGERKWTEIRVEATKLLDQNRETFEQVHQENGAFYAAMEEATAKFKHTTYPLGFEAGLAMLLKHLKDRQDAWRLIELDALFAAEQKNAERLMRALEMMLTLANSVEREPIMISVLVRVRGIAMAGRVTQLILQSETLSAAQFDKLRALWRFPPVREHFVKSLALERWVIQDLFTRPSSYISSVIEQEDGPGVNLLWQLYHVSGMAKADELNHMEKVRELQLLMSQSPSFEQHQYVQSLAGKLKQDRSGGTSEAKAVSRMFLPGIYKANERVITGEATVELVKLGLNVAEDFRANGTFAERLSDQSGTTNRVSKIDPFTGREFIYVADEDGVLIYSVGPNGLDERSVTFEKAKVDDFGFHVGRAN